MSSQNTAQEIENEDFVDELKPGTKLMHGQYVIEEFLAAGGFGITYLARDSLNRQVVIKECFPGNFCRRQNASVLPRSRAHQAELKSIVQLFAQEAMSLAKTKHPNIVGVHHVFEENHTSYMALDYVQGRDLLDILENDPASLNPALIEKYLVKTLGAVKHIHELGILHRDIAPDNIIINEQGEPILIDFGAARENTNEKVTRMLSALRTVKDGYSPQEFYIAGSEQSPSCDLYSLAASFYHVITGELPPDAQWRLSACASGDNDPYVPLAEKSQGYSPAFVASLDKAIAILPRERMQNADEWLESLKAPAQVVSVKPKKVTAPAAKAEKKSMMPLILGTTGLVAAAGAGLMFMPRSDTAPAQQESAPVVVEQTAEAAAPVVEDTPPAPVIEEPALAEAPAAVEPAAEEPEVVALAEPAPAAEPEVPVVAEIELAEINIEMIEPALPTTEGLDAIVSSTLSMTIPEVFEAPAARPLRLSDVTLLAALDNAPTIDLTVPAPPVEEPPVAVAESVTVEPETSEPLSGVDFFVSMAKSQPELKSVLSGPMRSGTSATATDDVASAPAAATSQPSSIITGFVPATPFTLSNSEPGVIARVNSDGPAWLTENTRIVSINGHPVATNGQINANFAALASGAASDGFDVRLGLTSGLTGAAFEGDLKVETENHTLLLNGLKFVTSRDSTGWVTKVAEAPVSSNFKVGDTLVSYVATWENLDGPSSLSTILESELENGKTSFSFAVERSGEIWIEAFSLTASAN